MGTPNPYAQAPGYAPPNPYPPAPGYAGPDRPAGATMDRVAGVLLLLAAIITGGLRLLTSARFRWNDVPLVLMIVVAIVMAIVVLTGAGARIPALRALAAASAGMLLATTSSQLAFRLEVSYLDKDQGWLVIPATIAALAATITVAIAANSTRPRAALPAQFPTQWPPPATPPQPPANPYPPQNPWPPQ